MMVSTVGAQVGDNHCNEPFSVRNTLVCRQEVGVNDLAVVMDLPALEGQVQRTRKLR